MPRQQVETYLGNVNVKKDGVQQDWTEEEIVEYQKCFDDPVYFTQTYVKIVSLDEGLVPFSLYPYQNKMFGHFNDNRFSIVLACRQSGKSISVCAYLLWYVLFNPEKTVAILANKGQVAREMLARVTLMLENIPFFLQPGCKALNKGSLEFSNNSRIIASATSGSSIRGLSVSLLYLDEFAFVEKASEFYTSTYPVISAGGDTKVIITSTANGLGNVFHKLWEGSQQNTNEFKPFRVDWHDVPGRDEKWKALTIANTSQLQFDQEFGNTFFGTGDTLINAETLLKLRASNPSHMLDGGDVLVYKEVEKKHDYVMTVDVSKGRGQDYSTFNVIDISVRPFEQVAVYRNNTISPLLFPNIIYKYAKLYNDAYVVIEANDQGSLVCNGLYYELEYENMHVRSALKADQLGVEMNKKVKRIGCSAFKDVLENNKLIIHDEQTIIEISTFVSRGVSFEASTGNHDDLVMNLVMFGYFITGQYFSDMTDINIKDLMFKHKMKEIEDDIVPFGYVDQGVEMEIEPPTEERPWALDHAQENF
tara:strand:- start:824 stop:2425 length:1602 start_codon:yes stop_codon:yes gene_type:complete